MRLRLGAKGQSGGGRLGHTQGPAHALVLHEGSAGEEAERETAINRATQPRRGSIFDKVRASPARASGVLPLAPQPWRPLQLAVVAWTAPDRVPVVV